MHVHIQGRAILFTMERKPPLTCNAAAFEQHTTTFHILTLWIYIMFYIFKALYKHKLNDSLNKYPMAASVLTTMISNFAQVYTIGGKSQA